MYEGLPGTVYLLHFVRPFDVNPVSRAQHYLDWSRDVPHRLRKHRKGRGSGATCWAHRQGVRFVLAVPGPVTWSETARLLVAIVGRRRQFGTFRNMRTSGNA